MATEDITLRVRIDQIEAELKKLPGITEREGKKMLAAISKTYREEEKAAKKAADEQIKQAERAAREAAQAAEKQLGALERVSDRFTGGLAGDLKDMAEVLGPVGAAGTTAAIGVAAVATAIAGIPIVVGAAVYALSELTSVAADTVARLDELGASDVLRPDQIESVYRAQAAFEGLQQAVGIVAVALVDNFAPDIEQATLAALEFAFGIAEVLDGLADTSILENFIISVVTLATKTSDLRFSLALLAAGLGTIEEAATGSRSAMRAWGDGVIAEGKAATAAMLGMDGLADATADASATQTRARATLDSITEGLRKLREQTDKTREATKKAREEDAITFLPSTPDQEIVLLPSEPTIIELGKIQEKAFEITKNLEMWSEEWLKKQAENATKLVDQIAATYGPLIDIVGDLGRSWERYQRQRLDETMDLRDKQIETVRSLRGEERAAAVEKLKDLTKEANERRRQIAAAFKAQQAAQVALALIDGARAAISLIPAFAFLGPGAPVAAAAVAGVATAAQVAAILAQKPKFHTGLDPSEMPAILTRGEGVANQRAMATPGFREQLRAANAGTAPAASMGPVVIALNDRVLAQLDARASKLTGRARGGTIRLSAGTATAYGG
jgi:hypothetical protein